MAKTSFLALLVLAIGGRIAIKAFFPFLPSVEPIIPIAILATILYGAGKGGIIGAVSYPVSNIFLNSFGPWSWIQAIAGMIAAIVPVFGIYKKVTTTTFIYLTVIGTVIYEIILNWYGGSSILDFGYFFDSAYFSLAHIASNVVFAFLLSGLIEQQEQSKNPSN